MNPECFALEELSHIERFSRYPHRTGTRLVFHRDIFRGTNRRELSPGTAVTTSEAVTDFLVRTIGLAVKNYATLSVLSN